MIIYRSSYMENKIQNIMQFYTMCVKLKNTIRTGPLV